MVVQWLERLTADQQVPGSIPGGGHGLHFVTGYDKLTNQDHSDVQQYEPNQNSNHNDYKKVS